MSTTVKSSPAIALQQVPNAKGRGKEKGGRRLAALFLAPTIIGITIFTLVPIVASLTLAFFRWDIISTPEFVGVDNFVSIGADPTIRRAFLNTIGFVAVAVSLQLTVSIGLAVLIQSKMPSWLRTFFRSAFFFPLVLSAASVSIIMSYLFNQNFGLVNQIIGLVGIPAVPWLTSQAGAMVVIILVYVWQNFGFTFLLIIGGLSSIPVEMYEASSIDGATGWKQFKNITLPLLSPTLLVASVMAIISALQIFDQPYVITRGGPGDSTRTAVMVIYETAFKQLDFGRAFAIGIVLTLLIMLVTAVQFRLSRRFVHYN
ncbi:sugar ABC transporter permease [Arthrobacter livingstonensis]|uniref:Sugar ABC transporter permease n=1 Tax=Arthrobacter livingstonensis TaxID=670078 RepID=A0A2V5L3S5_9MICC|nr:MULTISPECIES: sugar ABC transporter permease [Arthrobacter]PYI65939.1 sugar ABC transporter permease [Arthrobacter livingstonensis]